MIGYPGMAFTAIGTNVSLFFQGSHIPVRKSVEKHYLWEHNTDNTMKRILLLIAAVLAFPLVLPAQNADEIISRMEAEMAKSDQMGMAITLDMKIPILGSTAARMHIRGQKSRTDVVFKDVKSSIWMDETTTWTYTPSDNEVVIESRKASSSSNEENLEMLEGVTDGYEVKLEKETSTAWYFTCKKLKSNADKDDPKKMDIVVAKKTYLPISVSTKVKGITVAMKDAALGVSEADVTFDASKYPGVKITDKR